MRKGSEGDQYLEMYPELRRWIKQCVACGMTGYLPEMPSRIGGTHANYHIRRLFPRLKVDETGLCEQCRAALSASSPSAR